MFSMHRLCQGKRKTTFYIKKENHDIVQKGKCSFPDTLQTLLTHLNVIYIERDTLILNIENKDTSK